MFYARYLASPNYISFPHLMDLHQALRICRFYNTQAQWLWYPINAFWVQTKTANLKFNQSFSVKEGEISTKNMNKRVFFPMLMDFRKKTKTKTKLWIKVLQQEKLCRPISSKDLSEKNITDIKIPETHPAVTPHRTPSSKILRGSHIFLHAKGYFNVLFTKLDI